MFNHAGRRRRSVVPARPGLGCRQGVDAPLVPGTLLGLRRHDALRSVSRALISLSCAWLTLHLHSQGPGDRSVDEGRLPAAQCRRS